jgi:hypothetical protein
MPHTPGPWTISKNADGWSILAETSEIAMVGTSTSHIEAEKEANARLIAAGPDLLEACKRAYDMLHDDDYEDDGTGFLLAAIEKADQQLYSSRSA